MPGRVAFTLLFGVDTVFWGRSARDAWLKVVSFEAGLERIPTGVLVPPESINTYIFYFILSSNNRIYLYVRHKITLTMHFSFLLEASIEIMREDIFKKM